MVGILIIRLYLMSIRSLMEIYFVHIHINRSFKISGHTDAGETLPERRIKTPGGPDKALSRLTAVANPAAFPREKLLKIWYYN